MNTNNSIKDENFLNELIKKTNELSVDHYKFRLIEINDYHKGYFELLQFLTESPKPDFRDWETQFDKVMNNSVYIFVIEDTLKDLVIGSISCLIECKFIRNLGKVSHIEDVIVHPDYRKNKFGTKLIKYAIEFSKEMKCYKTILDSKIEAVGFYEKLGFVKKSEGMALYF